MTDEPMLKDNLSRYTTFPIVYKDLWELYKKLQKSRWVAEEIKYIDDLKDWKKLSDNERYFIEHILAFFAGSDGIVLENLMTNFQNEVKISEAQFFYAEQAINETVHSETYSLLIETFIEDPKRKHELFNAIEQIPCVARKQQWAIKWHDRTKYTFAERVLSYICVEGILFSGSFCAIFWLKSRGLMIKALGKSNEWISRDEQVHCNFGILLYKHLKNKASKERIYEIFKEAVEIEKEFITESIPCKLIGMNSELMIQYIKYVADYWIVKLGHDKIYNVTNPFDFMDLLSMENKTNFFELTVSEYRKEFIPLDTKLTVDEDF